MKRPIEPSRLSLEEGLQERRKTLIKEQTSQMQRLELMERVAVAVSDVLSARHAELSPVEIIISGSESLEDIHLSALSQGLSIRPQSDIPF
jgi:hypothetical protein